MDGDIIKNEIARRVNFQPRGVVRPFQLFFSFFFSNETSDGRRASNLRHGNTFSSRDINVPIITQQRGSISPGRQCRDYPLVSWKDPQ